jgi:membrane protein required for colicin V production
MTSFDWGVVSVIGLSTLFAYFRGVVRELIALVAWVLGFIAAVAFTPLVGAALPEITGHPAVRYVIAFALIIIAALLLGALIAWPIAKVIRAAGLGFVDRFLGLAFGFMRGLVVVLALVVFAGLTSFPQSRWWQNSVLAGPLVAGVYTLKRYLPAQLAGRLDYSPGGMRPDTVPIEQHA